VSPSDHRLDSLPGRDTRTGRQTDRIPIANTHSQQCLPVQLSRVKMKVRSFNPCKRRPVARHFQGRGWFHSTPWSSIEGSGERCEHPPPLWCPAQSPGRRRIVMHLELENLIWWWRFWLSPIFTQRFLVPTDEVWSIEPIKPLWLRAWNRPRNDQLTYANYTADTKCSVLVLQRCEIPVDIRSDAELIRCRPSFVVAVLHAARRARRLKQTVASAKRCSIIAAACRCPAELSKALGLHRRPPAQQTLYTLVGLYYMLRFYYAADL